MQELHRQVADHRRRRTSAPAGRSARSWPMTVASTPFGARTAPRTRPTSSRGTARTIRSWASEIQISVYESPSYFSGARSSQTSAPISSPISPTALEKPPAPQSVTAVIQPAVAGGQQHVEHHLLGDRVADLHGAAGERLRSRWSVRRELNVAPWMPSRPVRPPTATIRSPGCGCFERLVARDQPDVAAVDQRIAQVARVEVDRAVDGGDAHPVAVVAHAGDDALASRGADAARPAASRSAGVSGGAKQKTSVLQIGLAPRPVPSGSRITPPMPVLAPP